MNLVYGGVIIMEAKLIVWEACIYDWIWEMIECEFFKYFGGKR